MDCFDGLHVVVGDGPPTFTPERATLYHDREGRELYAWVGAWRRVTAPVDWMKERLARVVADASFLAVHRQGDGYRVAPVSSVVDLVGATLGLGDLADVTISAPVAGQGLVAGVSGWSNGQPARMLGSLVDVSDAASADDGDELVRLPDGWAASKAPVALDDLQDVDVSGSTPGEVLAYGGASWGGGTVSLALNDVADVNAPTPAAGDILMWVGSEWVAVGMVGQVVEASCGWCAPDTAAAGDYFLQMQDDASVATLQQYDGASWITSSTTPPFVVCERHIWRLCAPGEGPAYAQVQAKLDDLFRIVMVLVSAESVAELEAAYPDLPVGAYWLLVDGDRYHVMQYKAPGCHVPAPFVPTMVLSPACGIYGRVNGALEPMKLHAAQVCFSACGDGGLAEAANLQEAICAIFSTGTTSDTVGPCGDGSGIITTAVSYAQAVCALDDYISGLVATADAMNPAIAACTAGPINAATTLFAAVCSLSEAFSSVPTVTAADVTVTACAEGPVNANVTLQDALCSLSDAAGQPWAASEITVAACADGTNLGATVQDALCGLSALFAVDRPAAYVSFGGSGFSSIVPLNGGGGGVTLSGNTVTLPAGVYVVFVHLVAGFSTGALVTATLSVGGASHVFAIGTEPWGGTADTVSPVLFTAATNTTATISVSGPGDGEAVFMRIA